MNGPTRGRAAGYDGRQGKKLRLFGKRGRSPGRDAILNVNFPSGPCSGILTGRTVSFGSMHRTHYRLSEKQPDGTLRLAAYSVPDETCEEGTDFRAILGRYISIGIVRNVGSAENG